MEYEDHDITDEEAADVIDELSDDDIRERSQALHEAQEEFEEMTFMHAAQHGMPCDECAGAGAVASGSLGNVCPKCMGRRVIARPGYQPPPAPPFRQLRAGIGVYADALEARKLAAAPTCETCRGSGQTNTPNGPTACASCGGQGVGPSREMPALPPASSVPTMKEIQAIRDKTREMVKAIGPAHPDTKRLADYEEPRGLAGDGELGDFTDAELDDIEKEDLD